MKAMVFGLALAVGAAGVATGFGLQNEEPKGLFIGEDEFGNLIIEEISADHAAACGGLAPLVDACSNGSHVRTSFSMSHGFALMPTCGFGLGLPASAPAQVGRCYVGAATSQITHAGGARTFVCQIEYVPAAPASLGLSSISCSGSGTFPALGAAFDHNCFSDDSGTPGAGNSGTGLGSWRCSLAH